MSDANLRKHLASSIHKIPNVLFKSQMKKEEKTPLITILSSEHKRDLHAAAVQCVIRDGLSFRSFRNAGMEEFLAVAVPGYRGPHRKTVRRMIGALYSAHTVELRNIFKSVTSLALTTDIWKSAQKIHYISLTAHVLNDGFECVPIVIGCRHLIGRHFASNLSRYIMYELNRVGISNDQIMSITTDNGSDIKKATSSFDFGRRIACMAHNINLVVKKGLCLWEKPNIDE